MIDRGHLLTEQRNPSSVGIDRLSISDAFDVMHAADCEIPAAVAAAKAEIVRAIELVSAAFRAGGRLLYVGAGTSGRLGVLDAAECPPTFLSDPEMVQGIIAGGWDALRKSVEGAEDDAEAGGREIGRIGAGSRDVVFGITAGGTTPFVHGAIRRGRALGARTVFLACVAREQVADDADVSIRLLVGPEILTGSTRLKAGTATKLVLNMITTLSMVRVGKTYENLMVDVNSRSNAKLVDRATRIIMSITRLDRATAGALLEAADGRVKTALVMHEKRVDRARATELLATHAGSLAAILHGPGA